MPEVLAGSLSCHIWTSKVFNRKQGSFAIYPIDVIIEGHVGIESTSMRDFGHQQIHVRAKKNCPNSKSQSR